MCVREGACEVKVCAYLASRGSEFVKACLKMRLHAACLHEKNN